MLGLFLTTTVTSAARCGNASVVTDVGFVVIRKCQIQGHGIFE